MENATGYIIKNKDITLNGKAVLNIGNTADSSGASDSDFQIRIVENQAKFVVMEVICSCGKKTHVKCDYANNQTVK